MIDHPVGKIAEQALEILGELAPMLAELAIRVGSVVWEVVRRSGVVDLFANLG